MSRKEIDRLDVIPRGRRATVGCPRPCTRALELVRERCADFGPALAREKLREQYGVRRATLRKWMAGGGIRLTRDKRRARAH